MRQERKHHMVDFLFVITLFFLFALSSLSLVAVGANIYESSVNQMENNFTDRTAYLYLTEKLRQNDRADGIALSTYGDSDCFMLTNSVDDTEYTTYIYLYEGYLKELTVDSDSQVEPSSGQNILEADAFSIEETSAGLYQVSITCPDREPISFYISDKSTVKGGM